MTSIYRLVDLAATAGEHRRAALRSADSRTAVSRTTAAAPKPSLCTHVQYTKRLFGARSRSRAEGAFAASLECFDGIACWLSSEEAGTLSWRNSWVNGAGACYGRCSRTGWA